MANTSADDAANPGLPAIRIEGVRLPDGTRGSLCIRGGRFVSPEGAPSAGDRVLDGRGKLAMPPFRNMHTHAAMTLFRGFGEDLPLMQWLREYIWPREAKLTAEDVYDGTRLACLEMIRSGTAFFMDMYWHPGATAAAAAEMGVRACIAAPLLDLGSAPMRDRLLAEAREFLAEHRGKDDRIRVAVGPHAIYTASPELLRAAADLARDSGVPVHTHLSETSDEVETCVREHDCRPPEYLDRFGLLGGETYAAHCVHVNDADMDLLAARGVNAVTLPVSNLKLAVGGICPVTELVRRGVPVYVGTDGCSSNNNLDMLEEAKFAALVQKHRCGHPEAVTARQILGMATAPAPPTAASGPPFPAPGCPGDLILLDMRRPEAVPSPDPAASVVYALNGSGVDTVICAGRILMENRRVAGEEEILRRGEEAARRVLG